MQFTSVAQRAIPSIRESLSDRKTLVLSGALMLVMAMLLFTPIGAHAQTVDLPWDSSSCKMAKAFTGPWLGWVAAIAIAIAGVAFGIGEAKAPLQTAMRIAAGFSVAVSAFTLVTWLVPSMQSAITSAAC